jgi:hypothetical protein
MDKRQQNKSSNSIQDSYHPLENKWIIWAHLPDNTDWSINSYVPIDTFTTIEETIAVIETLPANLIENCMLFVMKDGIKPTWEDEKNRDGGCFSYKIINKNICKVWKELTYVVVGMSISNKTQFTKSVTGISISPKKNFCVLKIWMTDCNFQDPSEVTSDLKSLSSHGCIFRKNCPEY